MNEALIGLGYIGLFIACFIAATFIPFSPDVVMVALLLAGLDVFVCLIVASIGSWMGGMVNYFLGRLGKKEWLEKKAKISPEKLHKAQKWLKGKGTIMAFFSWVPLVGTLVVVALGYMRSNMVYVSISMLAGVLMRFSVVSFLTLKGMEFLP